MPTGTVHLDVDVDERAIAPDATHLESVDADPARREFDGVAFTGQFVGPLAVDLDGADRRRDLVDLTAQRGHRLVDLRVVTPAAETVCRTSPSASSVDVVWPSRIVAAYDLSVARQHAEDLGGPFDADHQHPGGHRVESACVTDLSGAEDAPAAADHVVTGHTRGLSTMTRPGLERSHVRGVTSSARSP